MPSTEIQRIILLVALGVVGYLLLQAWSRDYAQPVAESGPRAPQTRTPADAPAALPSSPNSDLPSGEVVDAGIAPPVESIVDEVRLVHVKTPVQDVWIDRLGGDIVGLHLPQHLQRIDDDAPVRLLDLQSDRVYVAQSGLIGRDGSDQPGSRPLYRTAQSEYRLETGTLTVTLTHRAGDVAIDKRFVFKADDYLIGIEYEIDNGGETDYRGQLFAQLKRDDVRPESDGGFSMGPRPYLGAAFTTPESRYEKLDFEDLADDPFRANVKGGWAAILQHYFLVAWVGDTEQVNAYYGRPLSDGNSAVGFVAPETVVPSGERSVVSAGLYAGPKVQQRLAEIAPNLELTVDYGILWWLSVPLFYVLDAMHSATGNWGVAIILLTLAVKILLYPLASAGFKSMAKMKQVMPQIKRLQERYAGDRQKLTQETMALYRKEGANPFSGCLPLLLQMPVFFALYWVLFESVELRHAPFALWINDLAAPDPWFVLPILYAVSLLGMQFLSPPTDPMQAKIMKTMPIVFGVLFIFFPAGLVLYWLVNNILSLAQQWYITRRVERQAQAS